nr:hypothetical protein [Tanacetum cinerariifolium]
VLQPVAPTTAEQRLARKNELKAHGTLLMALPNKHQLKFNSHKDAKTLMKAIEKRFGTESQNLAFVSSSHTNNTTDSVSAAVSVSAACGKLHASPLPNVDSLKMDLRWHMAMLTMRARRFLQKTGKNLGINGPTSMRFDMSKVECYNFHKKGHFSRECRSPKNSRRPGAAEPQRMTVLVETSTSNALVSQCDESNSKSWPPSNLYDRFQPSGGYHVVPPLYTGTFMPPKPDLVFNIVPTTVETDHLTFNVQLSPTKPEQDLSHATRPSAPIIEDWVSDSEEESETKALQFVPTFAQSFENMKTPRHSVKQIETTILAATPIPASPKSNSSGQRRNRKACFVCKSVDHLIKDCDYHTKKMAQPTLRNYAHRGHHKQPVSAALPNISVTRPRHAHQVVTKFKSPIRMYITRSPSSRTSNSPPRVTAVQDPMVSVVQGNMSYLSDFEELNGGYVAFGGTGPTWLFDIHSLTRTMNYQPVHAGNQTNSGTEQCRGAAFNGKEHNFDVKKHESKVILSPSSSAQSKEQDDKTKKEAKGKIPTVGQISFNSTNTFSAAGPSNDDIIYSDDEDVIGAEADFNNLESSIPVSPIPTTRIHKDRLVSQIIGDMSSTTQTRSMTRVVKDQGGLLQMFGNDFHTCMFAYFLSHEEPKRVLVDLPYGKRAIGTKWVYRNKKDKRGIVIRNKARLVVQGHTQEEGINYEEVFAPVERIEAIRLFLAYASFMGFMVYQMDVKSAFLYGTTEEEVYVCQPLRFEDPDHPDKVYKVFKALYGLHQAPRAWYETLATYLLENGFQRGTIDQTLFIKKQKGDILLVKQKKDGIFISQDKYVAEILRKFRLTEGKSASTPIDTEKPLLKDPDGEDVDVLKRIFRYLKGKPHLGLWYPKDSPFDLVAYSDSDYAGASLDRKSTTRGCQFLGCRLISWQCKKQTVIATSSTEAEYVAAASCCAQSNDVTRLQALVDKKKVVITKAKIRDALRLDDAEGVDFLPNEEIFTELARIGYEKPSTKLTFYEDFFLSQCKFLIHAILQSMSTKHTSWNEFRSAMAFAVICLSTDDAGDAAAQRADAAAQRADTLFLEMMFMSHLYHILLHHHNNLKIFHQHPKRVEHLEYDKVAQALEITKLKRWVKKLEKGNRVKVLKLRRLQKVRTSQRIDTSKDSVMEDASNHGRMIDDLDKDDDVDLMDDKGEEKKEEEEDEPAEVQEVVDVVTTAKLITEVVTVASESVTAASTTIAVVEPQVPAAIITVAPVRVAAASTRRRKGVVIRDPEEESITIIPADTKSKDKGKGIMVEEPKPLKKKQRVKIDEVYARKLHEELNKDIDYDVAIDHVKQKAKEDPFVQRYQIKEQLEEEENRAIESINETPAQKAAKRRKLNKEVVDLKIHLEIMPDEDDDVYTKATPLARKVPYVDYEIIHLNNKRHYKIIRADGTHQLYTRWTSSSLEESKDCPWSSKADFASYKEIPTLEVYIRSNVECSEAESGRTK